MSDDHATRVALALAQIPTVQSKVGVFVARSGFQAVVNIGESTVTLPFAGMYLPPPGHPVQLDTRDGQTVVSGPARPLPGVGKITATGSPRATVTAWGIAYLLPYRTGYTPVLNDDVEIAWSAEGGVIQGKVTATSTAAPPSTNPGGGSGSFHPGPFAAMDSGTWNPSYSKWVSADVWASASTTGAWFYGAKIVDTIPTNATITLARIYLNPSSTSGAAPVLQRHTSPNRPGGGVAFVGAGYSLPARSGWVDIPTAFITGLVTEGGALGLNHGGYSIFHGVQGDSLSGALDIAWTTP